jgi:alcohol dehydrogenase
MPKRGAVLNPTSGVYRFTRLESVIFGAGSIASLGAELQRRHVCRALIVTGASLGRSKLLDTVKRAAGPSLAGVFTGAIQHVPSNTVGLLVDEARRVDADSFISFGGGSPIDTTKVAAMRLLNEKPAGTELPHIAVPTTLSAGEFTPFGGMTDEAKREKGGVGDSRLQAKVVILDPELTRETPAWLWASTGMRALDHAVECAYSLRHQPLTDLTSARAIALLVEHLRPSLATAGTEELEHRAQCQIAAWFSIFGAMNTGLGVSHALGHQIGPYWNVPHGVTSCITLPHVMRFMAGVAPERFAPIAEGFGIRFDAANPRPAALECADRAAKFIAQFEVPTRLRDVGAPREELGRIAGAVLAELGRSNVLGRLLTVEELVALLEAAY